MNINQFKLRAQSTLEYVVVIIIVLGVFIVAGAYYKRALQGRYRQAGDALSLDTQY